MIDGPRGRPAGGGGLAVAASVGLLALTAPYGKLMHAVYRAGAVLRYAHERDRTTVA